MSHSEGYYYASHVCDGEEMLPKTYHNSYDAALLYLHRMQKQDQVNHLNCNWEVCFELREYDNRNRLTATIRMEVFDKTP